jgi:hypothetical protein
MIHWCYSGVYFGGSKWCQDGSDSGDYEGILIQNRRVLAELLGKKILVDYGGERLC